MIDEMNRTIEAAFERRRCIQLNCIRIGFIGAGRVGVSFGKYLKEKGMYISGYYSQSPDSAKFAAEFTNTTHFKSLQEVIASSDMLLFTVPDNAIAKVWEEAKPYVSNMIIGHCSGLHSSKIFSDSGSNGNYAYSIHPLSAVSSKESSWKEFPNILFTLEGDEKYLNKIEKMFKSMGNRTKIISTENKIKYHAAAALSSNYMTALFYMAQELFVQCGFDEKEAKDELYGLAKGNLENILKMGCVKALTGPLERNDIETVKSHIECLEPKMRTVYQSNADYLIEVAARKHPDRDYNSMRQICERSYTEYE